MNSEWKQIGCCWIRDFGRQTVVVRPFMERFEAAAYEAGDKFEWSSPSTLYSDSAEEVMRQAEARFDPQPEFVDRAKDTTYYRHGELTAYVADDSKHAGWGVAFSTGPPRRWRDKRESAENIARSFVLGEAWK